MGERLHTIESHKRHKAFLATLAPKWDPTPYELIEGRRLTIDADKRVCLCCQTPKPRATGVVMGKQWNCRDCYMRKTNRHPPIAAGQAGARLK